MSDELSRGPEPESGSRDVGKSKISIEQAARWGGILPIALLNAVLNIVTVTLWRFWGRTRVRRYLWSTTSLNGVPLEYTGTGFELFRSFLFVMFAIFLPIYALVFAGQLLLPPEQFMIYFGIAYIPILLLFSWLLGAAVWIARRYRLSRTSWRGIRFVQTGSMSKYAWASIGYGILTAVTFGWFEPVKEMRLAKMLWGDTWFGNRRFSVPSSNENLAGSLYPTYALYWFSGVIAYFAFIAIYIALLVPASLDSGDVTANMSVSMIAYTYLAALIAFGIWGIFAIPYQVAVMRKKAAMLGLDDLAFALNVNSLSFFWIAAGNILIIVFTLGFGIPIAQMRLWRYIFQRLNVDGEIDLNTIEQNPIKGPGSGEGLADAFDIGNVI